MNVLLVSYKGEILEEATAIGEGEPGFVRCKLKDGTIKSLPQEFLCKDSEGSRQSLAHIRKEVTDFEEVLKAIHEVTNMMWGYKGDAE